MLFRRLISLQSLNGRRSYTTNKPTQTTSAKVTTSTTKLNDVLLSKDHFVFNALGATEELLSFLGLAREYAQESEHEYVDKLKRIQTVIIDISTSILQNNNNCTPIGSTHIKELQTWLDEYKKELPPPEQHIIPGGGIPSVALRTARSICQRAERNIVPLVHTGHIHEESSVYLNKLAEFLFTLSRIAAKLDKRSESIYIQKPNDKLA